MLSALALVLTGVPAASLTGGHLDAAVADTGPDVRVFVNEVHYANEGVDAGEFVELAGPAGADLTGFDVVLYDGESGAPYASTPLTTAIGANGVAVVDYPHRRASRTVRAGVALVNAGEVTQFLSWGGAVTATGRPGRWARPATTSACTEDRCDSSPDASLAAHRHRGRGR